MHLSWLLLLSAVCVGHGEHVPRALWQFAKMIQCVQPGISPFIYNNYGCFCGFGGKGSPVDQLDQCCAVHDKCYANARKLPHCGTITELPHIKLYKFSCSNKKVSCSDSNDQCQAAVCECDRVAAHCFAQYSDTYNSAYKDYDRNRC